MTITQIYKYYDSLKDSKNPQNRLEYLKGMKGILLMAGGLKKARQKMGLEKSEAIERVGKKIKEDILNYKIYPNIKKQIK